MLTLFPVAEYLNTLIKYPSLPGRLWRLWRHRRRNLRRRPTTGPFCSSPPEEAFRRRRGARFSLLPPGGPPHPPSYQVISDPTAIDCVAGLTIQLPPSCVAGLKIWPPPSCEAGLKIWPPPLLCRWPQDLAVAFLHRDLPI